MPAVRASRVILGDWGTTRLRLHLCDVGGDEEARVIASIEGPGARYVSDFPAALLDALARLPQHPPRTAVVLSGMSGSSIGWRETSYVSCPAHWGDITADAVSLSAGGHPVTILPGASCINRFGYLDVMRGEETQLAGVMQSGTASRLRRLVGLPGTHTKWAIADSVGLHSFATTMQGELFELLRKHSILASPADTGAARSLASTAFDSAVELLRTNPELGFVQALFSSRSRLLSGELAAGDTSAYLSGLLVGADVRDVCKPLLRTEGIDPPVLLVGDPPLTALYARTMTRYGIDSRQHAGDDCSLRGLAACCRMLHGASEG